MVKSLLQISFIFILTTLSCKGQSNQYKPIISPQLILKSQTNFVKKYYPLLNFEDDFYALDDSSKIMNKNNFFDHLLTGTYLPVKLNSKGSTYYQLYKIDTTSVEKSISATIKSLAYYAYEKYKMEGKVLPSFDFIDLENNKYNYKTIKGKIVVLKFWFINCQRCVEEMPYLNSVVKKYQNRDDVIFLSLASDNEEELKKFLTRIEFKFPVVANQKVYLNDSLKIQSYPTYLILNKESVIVKVVGNDRNLETALQKEILK